MILQITNILNCTNPELFVVVKGFTPVHPLLYDLNPLIKKHFIISPLLSAASQMVVTDLTEPEKRADALSKLGLCFGIGMIAGSTLGGHLNTRYG